MNDKLSEAVQDLQEQAVELDYLDDLDREPGDYLMMGTCRDDE